MSRSGKASKPARKTGGGAAYMQQVFTLNFFVIYFVYVLFLI